MAVVAEKRIGNTRAIICDDYCVNVSRAAVDEILEQIAARALAEFSAVTTAQSYENDKTKI